LRPTDQSLKESEHTMKDGMVVVDADRHVIEPGDLWMTHMPAKYRDVAPYRNPDGSSRELAGPDLPPGTRSLERYSSGRFKEQRDRGFDAKTNLRDMDVDGIDVAVLFPSTGLGLPGVVGVDPELITVAARAYNTWLAEFCSEDPDRLFGVALLDLRDIDGACAEVERCVSEYGFVGAFLRPNLVESKPLYDPKYEKLWAKLEELNVPACFHEGSKIPGPQMGPAQVGDRWAFWHICTHPLEQQAAMVSMIMGGVLERHPALRSGFLECGCGWLPYWMWRMDEHAEPKLWNYLNPNPSEPLPLTPSEYVQGQCFASLDTEETPGATTVQLLDGHNIMWASDYPHIDSVFPGAVDRVMSIPGIDDASWRRIMGDNPGDFFGPRIRDAVKRLRTQSSSVSS
jgi:uncharacterized protein